MNFVGDIVATALMGQAFVENYPQLLEDPWIFDIAKLLSGMPGVTSGIRDAKAARRRLKSNIREWTEAIIATQDGKDAGVKWSSLSDVSETMKIRTRKYHESGAPPDAYVAGNLAIFWGLMVNSNKVIFWMLLNIVANEDLRSRIRAEITPYVKGWSAQSPTNPLSIDVDGLTKSCPLLKASFFETMRLYTTGTSYKGRLFAEREVLVFVSAIVTVWHIQPLSEGGWKIPGKYYVGTGSADPTAGIRVRFRRRRS